MRQDLLQIIRQVESLTPGFEHRLSRQSLLGVYAAFAAGLALGGLLSRRRKDAPTDS